MVEEFRLPDKENTEDCLGFGREIREETDFFEQLHRQGLGLINDEENLARLFCSSLESVL